VDNSLPFVLEVFTRLKIFFREIIHTTICLTRTARVFCVDICMYSFVQHCKPLGEQLGVLFECWVKLLATGI
jgi:hypothetical protein